MSTPWLTVLHHPGRPDYLQATLAELDRTGARELAEAGHLLRYIAVDGNSDLVQAPAGWLKVCVGNGKQGVRRAMSAILKAARGAEHLIYCEDDLQACQNAVLALHRMPVPPEAGFLVACNANRGLVPGRKSPLVLVAADNRELLPHGFWGSQALKIPGRALQYLAGMNIDENELTNSGDVWIGYHLASRKAPWHRFGVLVPSLFQHVGWQSLAWPGKTVSTQGNRMADDFTPGFDALTVCGTS